MRADTFDSDRLARAVALAGNFHRGQLRKGTNVPYMSHLLAVAALVAEDEGTEDEVIAALLHDAAEDQGGEKTLAKISADLGETVANLVRDCSDSLAEKGQDKAPWHERKRKAVSELVSLSQGALRVIAADKLHNTRATLADLIISGPSVWERFKTGRDGFIWYHEEVLARLEQLIPGSRSVQLLGVELKQLESIE